MRRPVKLLAAGVSDAARTLRRANPLGVAREVAATAASAVLYPMTFADSALDAVMDRCSERSEQAPDLHPVILVHGFGAVKSHWLVTAIALRRAGFAHVESLTYNPLREDIPSIAGRLVDVVDAALERSGSDKVHLLGHSMGGVIVRYAVEVLGLGERVGTAVTVAAPHGGSVWAHLGALVPVPSLTGSLTAVASQLEPGSALLGLIEEAAAANAAAGVSPVRWVAFNGGADIVVSAASATLNTPGACNVQLADYGHVSPLMSVMLTGLVIDALREPSRA